MKIILKYILLVTLVQGFYTVNAQKLKVQSVKQDYEKLSYMKTSEVLLKVVQDGYRDDEILTQLANSFYFNNNMEEASRWYNELFLQAESVDPELYFRHAMALKGLEDYEEADKWMAKFNEAKPSDKRSKAFLASQDYKSEIDALANGYIEIENLHFNTEFSDFGTAASNGNIVFASSRGTGVNYSWNDQPYLDLYIIYNYANEEFSKVVPFKPGVNSALHESSAAFNKEETLMFFTRNNYYKGRKKSDKEGTNRLQMFRAQKNEDGEWVNIKPVHFNSSEYSVSHPTITLDGKRMYFASDMDGTLGQSDIYVVEINEDGTLGTPENLGESINTEGRETFPFVNSNGDLYFSTDGLPGLGGLDVYVSRELDSLLKNSEEKQFDVQNVAAPINSSADDFGFYENVDEEKGFFSSNRKGGKGDDDIYSFRVLDCEQVVSGFVTDKNTGELLPQSDVTLYDSEGNELEKLTVGDDAAFKFTLECDEEYLVRGTKEDYSIDEKRFNTNKTRLELKLGLGLERTKVELRPCDDLALVLDIPTIYFDLDKYDIKYAAEIQLQKVLTVLQEYPTMTVDIRSHTDCRASYGYNLRLSDNRAKSTRQYLIDQGIAPERLTAKGYGESQLVNDCACEPTNNSDCSEEQHQENRRSEFIVTSLKGEICDEK